MSFIKKHNLHSEKQIFELNCELVVALPMEKKENLKEELSNLTSMKIIMLGIY